MNQGQELYDAIYTKCLAITQDTYDYLPMEDEPVNYPFIHVGNLDTITSRTNTSRGGRFTLTVDVWGTKEQRIDVSEIGDKLLKQLTGAVDTANYHFLANYNAHEKRMMIDTSVQNTVFQRCNLSLVFNLA